jgi:AcrR family transcriptional regulator
MTRAVAAFQQVREASRRKILDGALRAFAAKGCDATMADVAGEAGVSQGLAYRYFPSKEAIVSELVHEVTDSGGGFEERVKKVQGTAAERLGILLTNMLEGLRQNPEYPQFLNQVLRDESIPVELREAVANNFRAIKNTIRKLIVEAQACGDVAADDPDQLLAAVLAYVDGLLVRLTDPRRIESRKNFPDPKILLRMLKPHVDKSA